MKISEEKCIQINTIIDKQTSYIMFENSAKTKHVYAILKYKKKTIIMKELTIFSENVKDLQKLIEENTSIKSFHTKSNTSQRASIQRRSSTKSKPIEHIFPDLDASKYSNSKTNVERRTNRKKPKNKINSHLHWEANYNPLNRESKINKFIVPSLSKQIMKKGKFDAFEKNNTSLYGDRADPNKKCQTDKQNKTSKTESIYSRKTFGSPFSNIFKK